MNTGNNHDAETEELRKLAPALFSLPKKDCFRVPADYFTVLPGKIRQLTLQEKVQVFEAPEGYFEKFPARMQQLLLRDKKQAFEAPEGYFDDLAYRIQDRIQQKQRKPVYDWQWRPAAKWSLALVTTCLLLYLGSSLFTNQAIQKARPLTSNEIRQTLDRQLSSIDESVLVEQVDVEDIEIATDDHKGNAEEIENYLIDNNIDVNSIVNEL